ncbi:MAG: chromosome segregation protein SMC, partial [Deltaproteobacteria bacterium]|nr:chromosome segregation protein SMC [Deltaproteobacteria bacterium]
EIAVTRRVYRSSESEYLINKIPCRLKDITEFFMAAQIHSRGYALIEQGKIEEIIQAKPAEIRTMVEEAAGLALFKGRREISERKLERVRENLARVEDVIAELERQLNYARRQARKAETYKLIRDELSTLEKYAATRRIVEQRDELAEQSQRERALRERASQLRTTTASLQRHAEESAAELAARRDELGVKRRELDNLHAALEERARTRAFLERRLKALDEFAPEAESRLNELDHKTIMARAARAFTGARLAREQNNDDGANEDRLAALREQHRAAERTLREEEKHTEELKDQLAELMREAAVMRGRLGALAGERADLEDRLRTFDQAMPAYIAKLNGCRQMVADSETRLEQERSAAARAEALQRETAERELDLRTALANDSTALAAARDVLRTLEARAQRIVPNGASEKLRVVLDSLNGDGPSKAPAMLLDVVKAPPALEPALRAVLGEQLDAVIVDSPDFALRAIEILKQHESGRLSFIPDSVPATAAHHPIEAAGIAGRLLDMVEIEPRFVPIAEALLGHVVVAQDLRAAFAASNANGSGSAFVTPEGDLLWPHRVISGGSGHHLESGDEIDIRKRAMALEAAKRAIALAEIEHEELVRLDEWARLACRDALEVLDSTRHRVSEAQTAVNQGRTAMAKAEQNLALAEANCANARRRAAEVGAAAAAANSRLEELARIEQQERATLSVALAALTARRNETRELSDAMLALGSRLEARKAVLHALEQELSHQQQLVNELEGQIAQYRGDLERAASDRAEFEREIAALMAQDTATLEDQHTLEGEIEKLTHLCADRAHQVEAAAAELRNAQTALETLDGELMQCELRRERSRTLIEEFTRGFHEKFQAEFAEAIGGLEEALRARDPAKDNERLQELRARAEKIGEVNLAADSEVRELEDRAGKLEAERTDLRAALNDLTHTIQKLNREARKRFLDTFEGAAKNFTELLPKLLRGGKGRLELASAADVLEAGVEILVQPAGKKVKEIGLLSGGEKALSAMALIFALFLLNPSPFCVMDEVDAPLDEFSLAAFTELVQELKLNSQFIIVTHNQRTMQAADHIHGVTMDRPGISRIISLKIPAAA